MASGGNCWLAYRVRCILEDQVRIYQRSKQPAKDMAIHPAIHWIWREMNRQRASQEDVSQRAGVSSSAMRKWRNGVRCPNLRDVEAVINVLGGKLCIKAEDDGI